MARTSHRWDPVCPRPQALHHPVRIDPTGTAGPTRGQAAGPRWRRSSHGYYVPSAADRSLPEQRIVEEAARLPPGGAVSGWAALRMASANFFDGLGRDGRTQRPVPLVVGEAQHRRRAGGVVFLQDRLELSEIVHRHGVACANVHRAAFDEMRFARDVREAVVAMDMVAAAELVSVSQMREHLEQRSGWRGVPQVRSALELAVEDSRSPAESRLRLIWQLDAGLPRPWVNRPVFGLGGRLLGYADLFDEEAGMFVEYDGAEHRHARRHARDVRREDLCRRSGLEYVKVTGPDLADRDLVVDRILSARARALFLPEGRRDWTLAPPPGWFDHSPEDAMTLDERLAYRSERHGLIA